VLHGAIGTMGESMSDNPTTEKWTLEDGRRAERRVTEHVTGAGESEKLVELYLEEERPVFLSQRVIEKKKPFVYERKVETVDRDGNVVDLKTESIEPRVDMKIVEHIVAQSQVNAQSVKDDCDCHVTKDEMIDTIIAAIKADRQARPDEAGIVRSLGTAAKSMIPSKISSLGLADHIAERVDTASTYDKALNIFIWGLVAVLGYVVFLM
jgi:hypothetical protein